MPDYTPPIRDMIFAIGQLAGLSRVAGLPGHGDATEDLVVAVLAEAGKLAAEVWRPLNGVGDRLGCTFVDGQVSTPPGFAEAYGQFVEGGWNALAFSPEEGGQGLPWLVSAAVAEIFHSANTALALAPMLTQTAVDLLHRHGSAAQQALYLPRLATGHWTGTMALTEPQAGSDLAAIACRAKPQGDHWVLDGQKCFVSWGAHDLAENIVHFVLARTPGAPSGGRGLSLFLVPQVLVGADGGLAGPNGVACTGIERTLGLHGSPTCRLDFTGARAWLVGGEGEGLAVVFTMLNEARLGVGVQGLALAERAYQAARAHCLQRVQGPLEGRRDQEPVTIIHHADVRRTLLGMKARIEAVRGLAYWTAAQADLWRHHPDPEERQRAKAFLDLMTPVVKAWGSETGALAADAGLQLFGGSGYVEDSGVAQILRDARIGSLYEGTNGIQALDLVRRKILADAGQAARALVMLMSTTLLELRQRGGDHLPELRDRFEHALDQANVALDWLMVHGRDPHAAEAAATPFLRLLGCVCGGWIMARSALAARAAMLAGSDETAFLEAKIVTARFYAEAILPEAGAHLAVMTAGPEGVMALGEDQF